MICHTDGSGLGRLRALNLWVKPLFCQGWGAISVVMDPDDPSVFGLPSGLSFQPCLNGSVCGVECVFLYVYICACVYV